MRPITDDDETLFATFTLLLHHPLVVICFQSAKQESRHYPGGPITAETREAETECAMGVLGCMWKQLHIPDTELAGVAAARIKGILAAAFHPLPERSFAPAVEAGGHEQHTLVGDLADELWGRENVTHYLTYTNGRERSTDGIPVLHSGTWVRKKREAMDCYASQIACPATGHHFAEASPEFYAR